MVSGGERCSARFSPAEQLDALVWEDLCEVITNPGIVAHELQRASSGEWLPDVFRNRRKTVENTISRLRRQEDKLLDVYLAEVISRDVYTAKLTTLQNTRAGLEKQAAELQAQANRQIELSKVKTGIEQFCRTVKDTPGVPGFEQCQTLLKLLVDRVIVNDEKIEIRYVIPINQYCGQFL